MKCSKIGFVSDRNNGCGCIGVGRRRPTAQQDFSLPVGGKVTLKAWCSVNSGYVFQVIDTGIGIALEDIPKALLPFQQIDNRLNRKYEGTGVGLPLSKSLIEMHGGSLDLQSQVGVGTTVTVRFPAERIVRLPHGTKAVCAADRKTG